MESSEALSHLLVYIPGYNAFPLAQVQKKDPTQVEEQLKHRKSGQRKAVPTYEEYLKNIAGPSLDAFIKMLNPEFVSRAGLTRDEIISKKQEKLFSREAYEKYIKDFSAEEITRIIEKLPQQSADSARKKVFWDWRLEGHLTEGGLSAMEIILGWLGGNKKIVKAIRAQDKLLQGKIVQVIPPERVGEFKRKLRTLLTRVLDIIQCAHYAPSVVAKQNDRLKQLADSYVRPEFVVSLKWLVNPETVTPADSKEVKEIEYKIYSFFLGAEPARKLRAEMIEKDYHYPLNPDEYLGNPNQRAYFDMYLDIRVSESQK